MVKVDIEKFIAGCEEIDRKRMVITRVINTLVGIFAKRDTRWEKNSKLLKVNLVPIGASLIIKGHGLNKVTANFYDISDGKNFFWYDKDQ